MKTLVTTLFAVVAVSAFAASDQPAVVVLQDQHGNYTTMFVRPAQTRSSNSVALYVGGRGAGSRDQSRGGTSYGDQTAQSGAAEYRSR